MVLRLRSALVPGLSVLALFALLSGCGSSHSTAPMSIGGVTSAAGFNQGVITRFGTIHMGSGADDDPLPNLGPSGLA